MADSIERRAVYNAYSGDGWHRKVDKMPETQIIAIYKRLKSQGII